MESTVESEPVTNQVQGNEAQKGNEPQKVVQEPLQKDLLVELRAQIRQDLHEEFETQFEMLRESFSTVTKHFSRSTCYTMLAILRPDLDLEDPVGTGRSDEWQDGNDPGASANMWNARQGDDPSASAPIYSRQSNALTPASFSAPAAFFGQTSDAVKHTILPPRSQPPPLPPIPNSLPDSEDSDDAEQFNSPSEEEEINPMSEMPYGNFGGSEGRRKSAEENKQIHTSESLTVRASGIVSDIDWKDDWSESDYNQGEFTSTLGGNSAYRRDTSQIQDSMRKFPTTRTTGTNQLGNSSAYRQSERPQSMLSFKGTLSQDTKASDMGAELSDMGAKDTDMCAKDTDMGTSATEMEHGGGVHDFLKTKTTMAMGFIHDPTHKHRSGARSAFHAGDGDSSALQRNLRSAVLNPVFEYTVGLLLMLNAISIGFSAQQRASHPAADVLPIFVHLELAFGVLFTLELAIRLYVFRFSFFFMKGRSWNIFDFIVVSLQDLEIVLELFLRGDNALTGLTFIRMLRLGRVVRLLRMVRLIPELKSMVYLISASMQSFIWTMVLLSLLMYGVAVHLTEVVADFRKDTLVPDLTFVADLEDAWGSLWKSVTSLYQSILGGIDWKELMDDLERISWSVPLIFEMYIAFAVLVMLNLVTGVFVEGAQRIVAEDRDAECVRQAKKVFSILDDSEDNEITWNEFVSHLEDPSMGEYFKLLGISRNDAKDLFKLLDLDRSGNISLKEFVNGCLQLRGPAKSLDLARMAYNNDIQGKRMKAIEKRLSVRNQAACLAQAMSERERTSFKSLRSTTGGRGSVDSTASEDIGPFGSHNPLNRAASGASVSQATIEASIASWPSHSRPRESNASAAPVADQEMGPFGSHHQHPHAHHIKDSVHKAKTSRDTHNVNESRKAHNSIRSTR